MIKEIIAKFKSIFTVKEWEDTAQKAMAKKAFPVTEGINSLHRVKKAEEGGRERTQERVFNGQQMGYRPPAPSQVAQKPSFAESSLAEMMNAIRQQQRHT